MSHEEMNQRISRLENEIAELNKKLSSVVLSEEEKKRRDEHYAAIYDYCHKVAHETFMKFLLEKSLPTALSESNEVSCDYGKFRVSPVTGDIPEDFLKGTKIARDHFIAHSFGGFHETIEHDAERSPGILCSVPVSIEIDTNTITGELITAGVGVFCHEGDDAKGSFTKIGPFFLKVER